MKQGSSGRLGSSEPYGSAAGLNLRIFIQERFGARGQSWFDWLFERIQPLPVRRVLELGCGPGTLWSLKAAQAPPTWQISLTDASAAMVREAKAALVDLPRLFNYAIFDAGLLGVSSRSIDLLIVNGVFDLVSSLSDALDEAWRVLAPGGYLATSTGGEAHLEELGALVKTIEPTAQVGRTSPQFSLENGGERLASRFTELKREIYTDTLTFEDIDPILVYIQSESDLANRFTGRRYQQLVRRVQRELKAQGTLRVKVEKGLFIARKPA